MRYPVFVTWRTDGDPPDVTGGRAPLRPALVGEIGKRPELLKIYGSCAATVENAGHTFGEGLPASDKRALTAFLATL